MRNTNPIWVLVVHESGARIFSRTKHGEPLVLVETIDHPVGRLKNSEIYQDRSGSNEEWGPSAQKHGYQKHLDAVEKNALDFAHDLAGRMNQASSLNRFAGFMIVAGPKMQGLLRGALSRQLELCLVGTVVQNLGKSDIRDVKTHIEPFLEDYDRTAGLTRQSA
jgi:protein required for attachment to host cells